MFTQRHWQERSLTQRITDPKIGTAAGYSKLGSSSHKRSRAFTRHCQPQQRSRRCPRQTMAAGKRRGITCASFPV
jgi:hypothetical protein